jgi:tmRNA-binding protein
MELSKDMGHIPIVFIRFNPDEYEKDGENITSCWGNNKKGICQVKNSKKSLLVLAQHIDYWINPENITNKTIESVQLYYDIGEVKSTLNRDQKHHNKRSGINSSSSSSSSSSSKKSKK